MSFRTEAEMSERLRRLMAPIVATDGIKCVPEVNGGVGIPDYLLVKSSETAVPYVVALELKLRNWQRGFFQAFRYRNFTNEVYLVLDKGHLAPALAHVERFEKAGIGLASLDHDGKFEIHVLSCASTPFSEHLSTQMIERLRDLLGEGSEGMPSLRFMRTNAGRRNFRNLRSAFFIGHHELPG